MLNKTEYPSDSENAGSSYGTDVPAFSDIQFTRNRFSLPFGRFRKVMLHEGLDLLCLPESAQILS